MIEKNLNKAQNYHKMLPYSSSMSSMHSKKVLQSPVNLFPQVQARDSQGDIIQLLSFFKIVFVEILLKVQCTSHLGINFILSTIYMSRDFDTSNQSCSFFSVLFSFSMQQRKCNCFFFFYFWDKLFIDGISKMQAIL